MKKILLFCVLVSVISVPVSAQLNVSLYTKDGTNENGVNTVTRCVDANRDVTAYRLSGRTYIDLVEITPQNVYRVEVGTDIEINDLFILGSELFFCGYDNQLDWGVVGCMDIADFYLTSPATANITTVVVNQLNRLNKLVVNKDAGLFHVSAIGENQWHDGSYSYSSYHFFDCPDIMSVPVGYTVDSVANERYDDILLTNHYIVLFGYNVDPSINSVFYRKTDRVNAVPNAMFDDVHFFQYGDDAYSVTTSTAMYDDKIATAYFYMYPSGDAVTRVRVIDMAADQMTLSKEYKLPEKTEPRHIAYLRAGMMLVVMQDFTHGGTYNTNFVYVDLVSPDGTPFIEYKPGVQFEFMTWHDGRYYHAASGSRWFWKDVLTAPTDNPRPDCPKRAKIDRKVIRLLKHKKISRSTLSFPYSRWPVPMYKSPGWISHRQECSNQ